MIPKIIHYIWVGPRPLPEADRMRVEAWQRLLPQWEFRAWGNDNLDFSSRYLREAFAARAWNRVSDYIRMVALCQFGGVYLDTDVELLRDLEPLLGCEAFLGFQNGGEHPQELVNGAIFGAMRGHWLPGAARSYFDDKLKGWHDIGSFSGPGLITRILQDHGLLTYSDEPIVIDGVRIFPRRYFYPYAWNERYEDARITPDTYAVHHWAAAWVSRPSFRKRVRQKLLTGFCRMTPEVAFRVSHFAARRGWQL